MKVLVTGASGFIGRNLIERLENNNEVEILKYNRDTDPCMLDYFTKICDFVFHLAAVHRPIDEAELVKVNHLFFANLLEMLRSNKNACPVLLASSIQAGQNSGYGRSKLAAEKELSKHSEIMKTRAIIYRLTNTFGRYAKPNHHSVVATFCYNIARGLPIEISNPDRIMRLYYIDDVINSFLSHLNNKIEPDPDGFYRLPKNLEYVITLKELADIFYLFKVRIDENLDVSINDELTSKLYNTYLSYLT